MKLTLKLLAGALLSANLFLAACDDNNDDGTKTEPPKTETVKAFETAFPDALNVSWAKKKGYNVASFDLASARSTPRPQGRNSAWYPEGSPDCAFTNLEITWSELQTEAPAVAAAWEASPYKVDGYVLDDIDVKTYADSTPTYKLEIEKGDTERELVYSKEGVLLSDLPDLDESDDEGDENDPCPQEIFAFISANLPDAVIIEADFEDGSYYEVEIRIQGEERELLFDKQYNFLYMISEIDEDDYMTALPEAVYNKFIALAPDTEDWEDVAVRYDIKGIVLAYVLVVEDEDTDKEVVYLVDTMGNILK